MKMFLCLKNQLRTKSLVMKVFVPQNLKGDMEFFAIARRRFVDQKETIMLRQTPIERVTNKMCGHGGTV